jgi:hypothetical protein
MICYPLPLDIRCSLLIQAVALVNPVWVILTWPIPIERDVNTNGGRHPRQGTARQIQDGKLRVSCVVTRADNMHTNETQFQVDNPASAVA